MKIDEIKATLASFPYPDGWWVVTGAAMVLYGIRQEATDIDLGCTSELADTLQAEGLLCGHTSDGKRKFLCAGNIEVFEGWLCGRVETVGGLPVISPDGLLQMKRALGREKDRKDIGLILSFLSAKP